MAAPRREWFDLFVRILAASCGIDLNGGSDVLPYSPAVLEAAAGSGKEIG